ncbi:hypothetical protein I552_8624 [Mycobacterium xenopi 3993]|nr:hypothetical protein I552_8624 [Mycobacterium xenopi 3993]
MLRWARRCTANCSTAWPPTSRPAGIRDRVVRSRKRSGPAGGAAASARRAAPTGARRPRRDIAPVVSEYGRPLECREAWPDIATTAAEHTGTLRAALDQPPQTNEVGRSAALIGGLLILTRQFQLPVRLFEIGASAGLNLRADRYRYCYPGGQWAHPTRR